MLSLERPAPLLSAPLQRSLFDQTLDDSQWLLRSFNTQLKRNKPAYVSYGVDIAYIAEPILAMAAAKPERAHLLPFLQHAHTPQKLEVFAWEQQIARQWQLSPHSNLFDYTLRRVVHEYVDNDQVGTDDSALYNLHGVRHPAFRISGMTAHIMQGNLNSRKTRFADDAHLAVFEENFDMLIKETPHYKTLAKHVIQSGQRNSQPSLILNL